MPERERRPAWPTGRASADRKPRVAFVCSGQGPQWWAMGRQLLHEEPAFRAAIERCAAILERLADWSLLDELTALESRSRMDNTAISQPCIFALQVGLAELWASWGVRPEAIVGHSVGEVAAAFLAGVFSLDDAVRIIFHRGRTMDLARERGRMLAAGISADEARQLIDAVWRSRCPGRREQPALGHLLGRKSRHSKSSRPCSKSAVHSADS